MSAPIVNVNHQKSLCGYFSGRIGFSGSTDGTKIGDVNLKAQILETTALAAESALRGIQAPVKTLKTGKHQNFALVQGPADPLGPNYL